MPSSTKPLEGLSVVITGAGRGLGASYARYCAELGARLVIADVDPASLEEIRGQLTSSGAQVVAAVVDVADAAAMDGLADLAVSAYGGLDGWVNNAGIQVMGELDDLDPAEVRRVVEINLLGVIFGTQSALRVMRLRGTGSIVNTTSGAQAGMPLLNVYGATKGGVASLTYGTALDLADTRIRVNAIAPLATTPMTESTRQFRKANKFSGGTVALPPAENNAGAIAFLLSPASGRVRGQVLRVDLDGLSLMSHPSRIEASLARGHLWTYDDVQQAYAERLARREIRPGNRAAAEPDAKPLKAVDEADSND
ncbi:SDR family oxidoreductase [Nocardioides sp. WS12]|uniref:SDR family NAD(P)-dependent oxidoreductase n=1 Tax=Nocardioides sp. WS12 TaxID=2486272 RepID=UPI0015FE125D|nr:SDR family oxidoreductase [Nocardioides sp. WS12]